MLKTRCLRAYWCKSSWGHQFNINKYFELVVQRSEPAAHNGAVVGSNPTGLTTEGTEVGSSTGLEIRRHLGIGGSFDADYPPPSFEKLQAALKAFLFLNAPRVCSQRLEIFLWNPKMATIAPLCAPRISYFVVGWSITNNTNGVAP